MLPLILYLLSVLNTHARRDWRPDVLRLRDRLPAMSRALVSLPPERAQYISAPPPHYPLSSTQNPPLRIFVAARRVSVIAQSLTYFSLLYVPTNKLYAVSD